MKIWTHLLLLGLSGLLCAATVLILRAGGGDLRAVAAAMLGIPGVLAGLVGFCGAVTAALTAVHDAAHSSAEVRQAEAQAKLQEQQATEERLRRWALEDELGIDLNHDGYIGDPNRPRTNRYQPAGPAPARGDIPIHGLNGPRVRAQTAVADFVKVAWAYTEQQGCDPRQKAVGLARSNWVDDQAGPTSRERQWYDAVLQVLTTAPLRLVVDRGPGGCGRFSVDIEEALRSIQSYWQYVNIPAILLESSPPTQPSRAAQAAQAKGAGT